MKKIGILFGQETTFPPSFVERVNSKNEKNIVAEYLKIDKVIQGEANGYDVIIHGCHGRTVTESFPLAVKSAP